MEFDDRFLQVQRPKFDCLLFDLDDTLYPLSAGLANECRKNIEDYMAEKLGIDRSKIGQLGNLLYKNYGTTMAGLRAIGYDFDYDEYHSFVHGRLPYDNLKPDPILRHLLLTMPYRKIIFTNADKVHAAKALKRLGLEDCFEGIICFETLNPIHKNTVSDDEDDIEFVRLDKTNNTSNNDDHDVNHTTTSTTSSVIFDIIKHFDQPNPITSGLPKSPIVCKPSESAIEKALKIANLDPQRTMFFEDSVRNVQAGKRVGLHTVLPSNVAWVVAKSENYEFKPLNTLSMAESSTSPPGFSLFYFSIVPMASSSTTNPPTTLSLIEEENLIHDFDHVSLNSGPDSKSHCLIVKILTFKSTKLAWIEKVMTDAWTL
uniref:Uncharacterized protein n=1 Tax=Cannabis sativa TaxID=3483 RepID=A0A803QDR3_CANSA